MLISVTNFSGSQILSRDTDADLAEKNNRVLRAVEPAYGKLHVKRIINTQRFFDPDKAAGRQRFHLDHVKRRAACIAYHAQTAVYLALDNGKLALLFQNLFLLTAELLLDYVNVSVLEKIADRAERHIQHAQIAHGVQRLELPHAVVAIARVGVCVLGRDKPKRFIVAQRTGAEVEKPGTLRLWKTACFYPRACTSFPRRHIILYATIQIRTCKIEPAAVARPIGSSVAGYIFDIRYAPGTRTSATPEMLWINEIIDFPQAQK